MEALIVAWEYTTGASHSWGALRSIPSGQTIDYATLAARSA